MDWEERLELKGSTSISQFGTDVDKDDNKLQKGEHTQIHSPAKKKIFGCR